MPSAKPLPQDLQAFEDRRRQVSQDVWPYNQTPPNFEIGTTGLRHAAGFMNEEFLSRLRGQPGVAWYREMWDNSAVIGAVMFMIQAVLRECEWSIEAADDSAEAERWKEHAEQSLEDMDHTWQDFISEIMSFLIFGWAWFEIVLKLRKGETDDPTTSSQFEDGTWGIRKLELRSQDSLWQWKMDRGGSLLGMIQLDTWNQAGQGPVLIPLDKSLHFVTRRFKSNPEGYQLLRPVTGTYHYVKRMQELEAIGWSKDLPLALDTPVPTPDGWSTIGDLKYGDKVYDEGGKIRYVVGKSPIFQNPDVYEVEFMSGHSIKADGKHLWSVSTKQTRWSGSKPRLMSTAEMFRALQNGSKVRFSLGRTPVLDAPVVTLPVDPYLLGYWLGDGTHSNTSIAVAPKDVASLRHNVEACGLSLTDHASSKWSHCIVPDFLDQLRAAGVLGNKHIPPQYLRASPEQRLALLQGLMDTDGCSDPKHECEFANTNLNLIYGVMELVRTLGGKPRMRVCRRAGEGDGCIDGRAIVKKRTLYGVRFGLDLPAHRIPRKLAKHKKVSERRYGDRSVEHYVKSIRLVDKEPTQCITVDSPSHLFLAGEGMVPTHNCGTPVMEVPLELLLQDADPKYKALAAQLRTMLAQFQVDERAYAMVPSSTDKDGKPTGFKLSLLSSGGRRAMETSPAIQRYNVQIMQCFGADFLQVGQSAVGTRNVFEGKANLFLLGLTHYLDIIESTLNRNLVPKVYKLNNVPRKFWPKYRHGKLDKPDLDALGTFLQKLGAAGLLSPNKELEGRVLEIADLPKPTDDDLAVVEDPSQVTPGKGPDAAAGLMSDEQAKVVMDVNAAVAAKKIHPDSAAKLLAQRLGVDEAHAKDFLQEVEKEPVPPALAGTPPPPPAHGLPAPGAAQAPEVKPAKEAL